jgi:Transposase DDE domain
MDQGVSHVGVKTNVVTSVEVTDGYANDMPHLPALVETTASRFQIAEVSADKGYLSNNNFNAVANLGATPYIPFKVNSKGEGPELWRKLWRFYQFNRTEFLAKYHKRSNVESTFSMIKMKFGGAVRSKVPVVQMHEVLCKVVCHNLCVLVQSIYELGISRLSGQNRPLPKKGAWMRDLWPKSGDPNEQAHPVVNRLRRSRMYQDSVTRPSFALNRSLRSGS